MTINKCEVVNHLVSQCHGLDEMIDGYNPVKREKGIFKWVYSNLTTSEDTRSFIGAKTGVHKEKGLLFNFCPCCGVQLISEEQKK